MNINFQKLITNFKDTENLKFKKFNSEKHISPDMHLYEIDTNEGIFYVFEVDYVGSLKDDVTDIVKNEIGDYSKLYKIKNSPKDFETTGPVKAANVYEKTDEWNEISKYANDQDGSADFYFNFLFKK